MSNWTPGPWRVEAQSISQGRAWRWGVHHSNEATDDNDIIGWEIDDKANAELIALAPEMAAAILRFCDTYQTDQWFQDVAAKLRAIGEDNE